MSSTGFSLSPMEPNGLSLAEIKFFFLEVRGEENLWNRGSSYRWRIVERFSWLEKMASGKIAGE